MKLTRAKDAQRDKKRTKPDATAHHDAAPRPDRAAQSDATPRPNGAAQPEALPSSTQGPS